MIQLLIIGLIIMMVLGIPVAFALMSISTTLLLLFYGPNQLFILVAAFINQLQSEVLLAIPMFVLMAGFLQISGIGSDIYETMHKWFGGVRGGLSIATVGATSIIAAMSGVAATGTISMGMIALPEMRKRNYNKQIALGPILAGGALGPIIPPSTVMIIVASYSGVSTGKLFIGGVVPGLILAFIFCLYIGIRCFLNPELAPAIPKEERPTLSEKVKSLKKVIIPIAIIVLVLGVIYTGICTPTEASGIGAFASLLYTLAKKKLTFKGLTDTLKQTTLVSTMLMWIMMGGAAYSSLVNITRLGNVISNFIRGINMGPMTLLFLIIVIIAVLGMFIDATAIIMITVPILLPLISATGLDLFTSMLIISITICLGMITPPFGVNIFYLKSVTPPDISLGDLYKSAIPFSIVFLIAVFVFAFFPQILTWLPNQMFY